MGIFERVLARDRLRIKKAPGIKIYCVMCRNHIFNLKGHSLEDISPARLVPHGHRKPAKSMICPHCNSWFVAWGLKPFYKTSKGIVEGRGND